MEEDTVFIGGKDPEIYLRVIIRKIENGIVRVKTRGKYIYDAVKICEYLVRKNKFIMESVKIGSSVLKSEKDSNEVTIPDIEIILKK